MTVDASSFGHSAPGKEPEFHTVEPYAAPSVALDLTCAVIAIHNNEPVALVVGADETPDALPSGRFLPTTHADLEGGLRECVLEGTGLELGYVEQLGTFSEHRARPRSRHAGAGNVSIGYLALMLGGDQITQSMPGCAWRSVYDYFPWEDWRQNRPQILTQDIEPKLKAWAEKTETANGSAAAPDIRERLTIAFGLDGARWDDERVLERYELLCDAGLLRAGHASAPDGAGTEAPHRPMQTEHRRILAAAVGRLRAKIRYRPVVFELMQAEFTLFDLQRTVEAILGPHLHKQNFRRLVESVGLVEPTGEIRTHTGGRPARLYRFRREVLLERPAPGVRVKAVARG
jgi:hypothetical protein